jgi:predicted membrane protein
MQESIFMGYPLIEILGNIIGTIGAGGILIAYFMLANNHWTNQSLAYYLTNLAAAILLVISLCINFNLGSMVIEIFYIIISLQGIFKNWKTKTETGKK